MPNPIKYNVSAETLALKKGNFWIGNGSVGKGPTSSTGFYNGITPPTGGYTIYLNKANNGPSIYVASNDAQLIVLTNQIAGQSYTTVNQCFTYYYSQTDKVCVSQDYPSDFPYIVLDGLVLYLDAGITLSYPGNGTTWTDVNGLGPKNNGTLTNGPTYNSANGGSIVFDGVDDQVNCGDIDLLGGATAATWEAWFKVTTINNSSYWKSIITTWNDGDTGPGHTWLFDTRFASWAFWIRFVGDGTEYSSTNFEGGSSRNDFVANTWYHMVGVFDSSQPNADKMKIYINGSYISSYNVGNYTTIANKTANERLKIGVDRNVSAPLDGNIAIARIYKNKGLTATEVLQNYNAQKSRFGL